MNVKIYDLIFAAFSGAMTATRLGVITGWNNCNDFGWKDCGVFGWNDCNDLGCKDCRDFGCFCSVFGWNDCNGFGWKFCNDFGWKFCIVFGWNDCNDFGCKDCRDYGCFGSVLVKTVGIMGVLAKFFSCIFPIESNKIYILIILFLLIIKQYFHFNGRICSPK